MGFHLEPILAKTAKCCQPDLWEGTTLSASQFSFWKKEENKWTILHM